MNEELKIIIKAEIADLEKKLKEVENQISKTAKGSSKLSEIGKNMGEACKKVAAVSAAAFAAAGAGVVALTKQAIDNYAEYEQLVGGVETLFKGSADTVKKYVSALHTAFAYSG